MGAVQMEMVTLPGTHMRTWYFNISFISTTKLWSILATVVFLWDWLFIPYQSHVKDNILGNVNGIFLHFLPICLSGKRPLGQSGTAQGGATEAKPWAGAEQVQIFSIFSTFLMFFSIFSNVFEYIFQYFQMSSISFLIFSNVSSIFSKIQFSSTSKIFIEQVFKHFQMFPKNMPMFWIYANISDSRKYFKMHFPFSNAFFQ